VVFGKDMEGFYNETPSTESQKYLQNRLVGFEKVINKI
jgi:hypothetical protein